MLMNIALATQLTTCAIMTGVIWVVQLILYPSFVLIERRNFSAFHSRHSSMISIIVGPVMTLELVTALFLAWARPGNIVWLLNLAGVLALWGCTGFLSVPAHNKLEKESDPKAFTWLVFTNWPRTVLWTSRLLLLISVIR